MVTRMRPTRRLTAAAIAVSASVLAVGAARAKVVCEGPYQSVGGSPVITPYCEAENLARVAQSRGIATTATAIRNDPATLKHVCMDLHGDPRVEVTCDLFTQAPF